MSEKINSQEDLLNPFYDNLDSQLIKIERKQTKLPFEGQGLFAIRNIEKSEIIAEYYGSVIASEMTDKSLFDKEDKLLGIDQKHCIISRSPASLANDIVDLRKLKSFKEIESQEELPSHKGFHRNAKFIR